MIRLSGNWKWTWKWFRCKAERCNGSSRWISQNKSIMSRVTNIPRKIIWKVRNCTRQNKVNSQDKKYASSLGLCAVCAGKHWIKSMLLTASLFPFTCFGIGFALNTVAIFYHSLAAIPFGTMVSLCLVPLYGRLFVPIYLVEGTTSTHSFNTIIAYMLLVELSQWTTVDLIFCSTLLSWPTSQGLPVTTCWNVFSACLRETFWMQTLIIVNSRYAHEFGKNEIGIRWFSRFWHDIAGLICMVLLYLSCWSFN